jgi:hypothetical protein
MPEATVAGERLSDLQAAFVRLDEVVAGAGTDLAPAEVDGLLLPLLRASIRVEIDLLTESLESLSSAAGWWTPPAERLTKVIDRLTDRVETAARERSA